MKIPDCVSNELIEKQITALGEIIEEYKNGTHDTTHCLLCANAGHDDVDGFICDRCPWVWFTKIECHEYTFLKSNISVHEAFDQIINYSRTMAKKEKIIKNRIRQIKVWILKLKRYLNENS